MAVRLGWTPDRDGGIVHRFAGELFRLIRRIKLTQFRHTSDTCLAGYHLRKHRFFLYPSTQDNCLGIRHNLGRLYLVPRPLSNSHTCKIQMPHHI
jgi:hypothetical protein